MPTSLFHGLRRLTRGRRFWLRATGSTFGSQLPDSLVVLTVAFADQLAFPEILAMPRFNFAVAITPLIYLAPWIIDTYPGSALAHKLTARAATGAETFPFSERVEAAD